MRDKFPGCTRFANAGLASQHHQTAPAGECIFERCL
jgi:hypothetical protein